MGKGILHIVLLLFVHTDEDIFTLALRTYVLSCKKQIETTVPVACNQHFCNFCMGMYIWEKNTTIMPWSRHYLIRHREMERRRFFRSWIALLMQTLLTCLWAINRDGVLHSERCSNNWCALLWMMQFEKQSLEWTFNLLKWLSTVWSRERTTTALIFVFSSLRLKEVMWKRLERSFKTGQSLVGVV